MSKGGDPTRLRFFRAQIKLEGFLICEQVAQTVNIPVILYFLAVVAERVKRLVYVSVFSSLPVVRHGTKCFIVVVAHRSMIVIVAVLLALFWQNLPDWPIKALDTTLYIILVSICVHFLY